MKNFYFVLILVTNNFIAGAQNKLDVTFKNSTFVATDSILPFWFTSNQSGKIRNEGSFLNVTDIIVNQPYRKISKIDYTLGVNVLAAFGETSYFQVNQAYAGVLWKSWELKAGMFCDPARYAGLSTTNGNMAKSQNARPYPEIRLATLFYKPLPFMKNRLNYKAEYSEGILNDVRYVDNTRLHHKSLYLQAHLSDTWKMHAGLEHFVMWGGTSPEESIGKMPSGMKDYLRYIFGKPGNESFPETDQGYVAGNQLGTWQFQVQKEFRELAVSLYLSHLFEELSGLRWRNWPDNLLGLHLIFKDKEKLITDVVFEYTNTRQQSILETEDDPDPGNYFRHGIYRSSFTYHQQLMGSPLFFPLVINEGIVKEIDSNKFYAHHLGLRGNLSDYLKWKGILTRIHHFGLYTSPYEESHKQISGHLEIQYSNPTIPVDFGLSIASDIGNSIGQKTGFNIWILKDINSFAAKSDR